MEVVMNILIISPHPDDEVIGCGGTIIKHIENGDHVRLLYISSGGNLASEGFTGHERVITRENEAIECCKILGVDDFYFLKEKERYLQYTQRFIEKAVLELRAFKPEIIYFPHSKESDADHRICFHVFNDACWLSTVPDFCKESYEVSIHMPEIRLFEVWTPLEQFNLTSDISSQMNKKIKALEEYKSQLKSCRYDLAIKGLNLYRAIMGGRAKKFAEVFQVNHLLSAHVTYEYKNIIKNKME